MSENRYALPGWLSIIQAILFPLAFGMAFLQAILGARVFRYHGPMFGLHDILIIAFTIIGVYTLLKFRQLLNERYQFHEVDTLILLIIVWNVSFQCLSLGLKGLMMALWPVSELAMAITYLGFLTISMVTAGILDILLAIKLLKGKEIFGDLIKAFAYIALIAGILEVSIFLSLLALVLVPVSCVILGLIFLRSGDEVEFV